MTVYNKKYCIVGTGGFGREVLCCLSDILSKTDQILEDNVCFMVSDEYYKEKTVMEVDVIPLSSFDPERYKVVVAIGDPAARKAFVERLPPSTEYATLIHPTAVISKWVELGDGSIVTAGTVLTCNIRIGRHAHLNLHTTIGHDCTAGDYFTTAPGVNISGNCKLGHHVYLGTNASIKQSVSLCDHVTIGMGGVVVKDIKEEGVYIGNPLKKLEKKTQDI